MTDEKLLFSEFEGVTPQAWKETATRDLKGADYEKKLVWKTDEAITVQPFYTSADIAGGTLATGKRRGWINYVELEVENESEANARATALLPFDASGILFSFREEKVPDFNMLLKGIDPSRIEISFRLPRPAPALLQAYFDWCSSKDIFPSSLKGFIQTDVLETWSMTEEDANIESLARQVIIAEQAPAFQGLVLSSHAFVNSGGGVVQELAFTLNKLTDVLHLLEEDGVSAKQAISNLGLHLAIGGDYFFEIAKLRAIRPLLKAVLRKYVENAPDIPIMSSGADWSKTLYDPNVNLLRNTTEAMSAVLGGCDRLLVPPHNRSYGKPDLFSHRIALHVSNLLEAEAYFDKVADPSAGSYYIETITRQVAEEALTLFREIEAEGGYTECFVEGIIQEKIDGIKIKKEAAQATRKSVYVGTNKYPNLKERLAITLETALPGERDIPLLHPQRATQLFETMRLRTEAYGEKAGRIPKVLPACFGNLAMRKARAAFTTEFFGTAGFCIADELFFTDIAEGAATCAASDADIVVICSSDAEYETDAARFAEAFTAAASGKKLLLAGYPEAIVSQLKQAGVQDFIHVRTPVTTFIGSLQDELFAGN